MRNKGFSSASPALGIETPVTNNSSFQEPPHPFDYNNTYFMICGGPHVFLVHSAVHLAFKIALLERLNVN